MSGAMELLSLLGICFIGTIFWFVNSEMTAVYYGSKLGWHWAIVGVTCAVAQTAMYVVLYKGGERLMRSWRWFGGKIERVQERYGARLEAGFLPFAAVGSVLGVPPATAMPVLAPGFRVPILHVLPIMFCGRFVRFSLLAALGEHVLGA
jgi:membrane protein YqaA with SNARE-associated domain